MPFSLFLQGLAFGLTAAAAPGALQTYLINQTLSGGWRRAAPVALSPLLSDPPLVAAILLLLEQIPPRFISLVSLAGGGLALYLAWGLFRSWRKPTAPASAPAEILPDMPGAAPATLPSTGSPGRPIAPSAGKNFLRGALMTLLSPGPYTFWTLVLGPLLLAALENSLVHGLAFLTGFYTAFIGGMLVLVSIFHQARRLGPGVLRALTLLSICILALFGSLLVYQGIF